VSGLEPISATWQSACKQLSDKPVVTLPLISARHDVTFPSTEYHCL